MDLWKTDKMKCMTFLHMVGDEAIKVFNTMDFDEDVDDLWLKELFRQNCERRRNISYLRQIQLDEDSSNLCTCDTPFGSYQ